MAWEIDNAHTLIEFSAKHMMVTTVKGRFTKFSGVIDLDEPNHSASRVDVTIDATSITTGDENRDGHLKSPDFLDTANYPTITFKSTSIDTRDEDHAKVTGDLTVHGVTKPVVLDVTREGVTKNMRGERLLGYSVRTTINREDFGLVWNVALEAGGWLVGKNININIEAEVFEPAAAAAAPAQA